MSREIKFRAWDKKNKEWAYLFVANKTANIIQHSEGEFEDWQQYTGIKDKNGDDIYFGDILDYEDVDETPGVHFIAEVIETINGGAGVLIDGVISDLWEDENVHRFELIGNVYQNPELLEDNK